MTKYLYFNHIFTIHNYITEATMVLNYKGTLILFIILTCVEKLYLFLLNVCRSISKFLNIVCFHNCFHNLINANTALSYLINMLYI